MSRDKSSDGLIGHDLGQPGLDDQMT